MPATKPTQTTTKQAKPRKLPDNEQLLVDTIEGYWGIEYAGDKEGFIEKAVQESKRRAKADPEDVQADAKAAESIDQLRNLWEGDYQIKETPEQKAFRQEFELSKYPVALSFPDEKTWQLKHSGKEDTGHVSSGASAAILSAKKMLNIPE